MTRRPRQLRFCIRALNRLRTTITHGECLGHLDQALHLLLEGISREFPSQSRDQQSGRFLKKGRP